MPVVPELAGDQRPAVALQNLSEGLHAHRAPIDLLELDELRVVGGIERRASVDAGDEHAVADDAVRGRVGAGRERSPH